MDIKVDHLEGHNAQITVRLDSATTQAEKRKALRKLGKNIRIPGFRPGKAPQQVIEGRIGKEAILEEVMDGIGNKVYREALEQSKLEPAAVAEIVSLNEQDDQLEIVFNVPKAPEVTLSAYKNIRMDLAIEEITDEMIDKALEHMREENAVLETVEREAQIGDELVLDLYLSWWHEDDDHDHDDEDDTEEEIDDEDDEDDTEEEIDDEDDEETDDEDDDEHSHGHEHSILDEEAFKVIIREDGDERDILPGFSAHLVGLKAEDEKVFSIELPEDWPEAELAGKKIDVDLQVQQVNTRTLPPLNDLFAATATNGEADTLLALRIKLREDLYKEAKSRAEADLFDQFMTQVYDNSEVLYHEASVEEHLDDYIENLSGRLREQANMSLADYLKLLNVTEASLREDQRETAKLQLKRQHIIRALVEQEDLRIDKAEIDAKFEEMLSMFGEQAEQFRAFMEQSNMRQEVIERLLSDKLVARVVAISQGQADTDADAESSAEAETTPEEAAE